MRERFDELVLHLIGDFWDFGVLLLMNQPAQQLLLLHQVTLINMRNSTLEQNHCGKLLNSPLVSLVVIVNLHEGNVVLIAFIVDVFELGEDLLRLLGVFIVWREIEWK